MDVPWSGNDIRERICIFPFVCSCRFGLGGERVPVRSKMNYFANWIRHEKAPFNGLTLVAVQRDGIEQVDAKIARVLAGARARRIESLDR